MKRHTPLRFIFIFLFACAAAPSVAFAQAQGRGEAGASPQAAAATIAASISSKTAGMQKLDGYFPLYWDAKAGKLWLEISRWSGEFLYVSSLPAGLGSNDVGLDRGQLGSEKILRFERVGPRVLLIEPNYGFRANTANPDEQRAVREAFAESAIWGFEVAAEESDGRALVDATPFFLRDAHDVIGALRRSQQGQFRLDASRSALYLPRTKNFPKNTEVEATLTFAADDPGGLVRSVTPTPQAVTVRQHHSLVELPPPGFVPRAFDPRAGFFPTSYYDFATPVGQPLVRRFITRHRLEKKEPSAAVSEAVKPVIYYLDPGTPEPVRSALLEGGRWWNQAFEAAGFRNAFRVEMLPDGADPMDIRNNMIVWIHRSTRGWAYGSSVVDPRTGEIIKGQVSLDSQRIRQDFLIAEGLLAPYAKGKPDASAALAMSIARIRQLSAHEIGHTLGLAHSYAASAMNRASVMDYPHPLVKLGADGAPDVSDAYSTGIGEWDKIAIRYGYSYFAPGVSERAALEGILQDGIRRGIFFLTDQDARPPGSASPVAHLWDSGANAVDELAHVMKVRAAALARFGEANIPEGAPMSTLEDVLVPVYLYHRYQTEAAAKFVGGADYRFALRGDGQKVVEPVPMTEQRRALESVLATISPQTLALPDSIAKLLPPRVYGYGRSRENFRSRSGLTFDVLAPAESAANHSIGLLLNGERAARLIGQHAANPQQLSLRDVIQKLLEATFLAPARATPISSPMQDEVQRTVNIVALHHLMALALNDRAAPQARAVALQSLMQLKGWLNARIRATAAGDWHAHYLFARAQIKQFEENPKELSLPRPLEPPDGQPIGAGAPGAMRANFWLCDWR